ncbi:MAG: glycosyltransferase family 2 protein [Solirubrobacterales bacterium]
MSDSPDSRDWPATGGGEALSVVIVIHDSADALERSLPPLLEQLRAGDELILCDNDSGDGGADLARRLAPRATIIAAGVNVGFAAGCNLGAERAGNELIVLLNPDVVVAAGWRDAIELPFRERRGWSAWQGLVTAEGGARLNSRGGTVHFSGIAWADGAGSARSAGPDCPTEVAFASGACLAIHRAVWRELDGFSDPYFLYHEDADLGLRLWLAGHRVGIEPRAVCDHDYDFDKGARKWRYLERNRWATILRTYPAKLLLLLAPALFATELALLVVAAFGGWLPQKLRANAEGLRRLPRLLRERRTIQAAAEIDARTFADHCLKPDLDSAYLGRASDSRLLKALLRTYWRATLSLL